MKVVDKVFVVSYVYEPITVIKAATVEEAKKKFEELIIVDIGEGRINSDHQFIEFTKVDEYE